MNDHTRLLHNMSSPPKSVVKYAGLSELATPSSSGGSGATSLKYEGRTLFGTPVRFDFNPAWLGLRPVELLHRLEPEFQEGSGIDPERRLAALINQRAGQLPLPDGCAVIPAHDSHAVIWTDPLTVISVLSKSTETVWLRAKTPSFASALQRGSLSLLVPPAFAIKLPGGGK